MGLQTNPGNVISVLGGAFLVALGVWVLTLRPRARAHVAFATYALLFGARLVLNNLLTTDDPARVPTRWGAVALQYASMGAVAWLASIIPTSLPRRERHLLAVAGLVAAPLLLSVLAVSLLDDGAWSSFGIHYDLAAYGFAAVSMGVAALVGLRHRRQPHSAAPLAAAALLVYPAYNVGNVLIVVTRFEAYLPIAVGSILGAGAVAAVWASVPANIAPRGRWVSVWIPSVAFFGMLDTSMGLGLFGATQALSVLLFAWAILRHQMLGVDVKLRWVISHGTIAAAFVAAFFVASEAAQLAFGAAGPWVGLAAAGALVFALAPVQRAAERLAERAVPIEGAPTASGERERRYREQLAVAWSDGRISPKERLLLSTSRAQLGLTADEADAIERAYLAEAAGRAG